MLRTVIVIVALVMISTAAMAQNAMRIEIDEQSSMVIRGGSNVHDWEAYVGRVTGHVVVRTEGNRIQEVVAADLSVAVDDMDSKNGIMNGKMRKALKAEEHPLIRYVLRSAEVDKDGTRARVTGELSVAGASRSLVSQVGLALVDGRTVRFEGGLQMSMSDFGIRPPTAMLGALRTHDRLEVEFALVGRSSALSVGMVRAGLPSQLEAAPSALTPRRGSTVSVEVHTSVNRCVYRSSDLEGVALAQVQRGGSGAVFDSVWIRVPTASLTSHNAQMDRDLRRLIDQQANPWIVVRLDGFALTGEAAEMTIPGRLLLAGVENGVLLRARVSLEDDAVTVSGQEAIDLRDYGLEPPRKLAGLIRVSPSVQIQFALQFTGASVVQAAE
jgi:polyisoprenoid-binding protein YceI